MTSELEKAKKLLSEGGYTCVICGRGEVFTSTRRGVAPLLGWLDGKADMKGLCAADRVVGKAAAFLYVLLGVKAVYAGIMSRPAVSVLERSGIDAVYGELVDAIMNRTNTGYCPMEMTVWDIEDASLVPDALKKKLAELSQAD